MPRDVGFDALLDQYNEEYIKAEPFGNWMPPDGTYTVTITDVVSGRSPTDEGKDMLWWRLTGEIINEGDLLGRKFCIGFFRSATFGALKPAAELLSKTQVKTLRDADKTLTSSVGSVLVVKVFQSTKYDRQLVNIQKVLDTSAPEQAAS